MRLAYIAIDPQELLAATAGDAALFCSLSHIFLDAAPAAFARMEQAGQLDAGGASSAFIAASHSLRGMTALVGARALTAQLAELERQAKDGHCPAGSALAPASSLLALVCDEVRRSMDSAPGDPA
ncbi:Hpt domain-containing protein [Massilia sp. S19_KUP03_FR1]|uniref:Hpt domain-containing protein n=1 Tax=Massilia sp. S19_KUP03_FR1 TaxID=3025503 RepID=UPI002FCD76F6